MNELELAAMKFAGHAHKGQARKYTDLPYITHPAVVAEIVRGAGGTPEMIAAAWLHDVVEDCGVTLFEIQVDFGRDVADLVDWLTDAATPADGNRATRKAAYVERMKSAPAEAQTIKLADLIDNTRSIALCDPGFAKVYLPEKRALLDVLGRGDVGLLQRAFLAWEGCE